MKTKKSYNYKTPLPFKKLNSLQNINSEVIPQEDHEESNENNLNEKSELRKTNKKVKQQNQSKNKLSNQYAIQLMILFLIAIYGVVFWLFIHNVNQIVYQHQGKQWNKNNSLLISKQQVPNIIHKQNSIVNSQSTEGQSQNLPIESQLPQITSNMPLLPFNTNAHSQSTTNLQSLPPTTQATQLLSDVTIPKQNTQTLSSAAPPMYSKQFNIKLTNLQNYTINNKKLAQYGIDKDIQIASPFDNQNITQTKQFKNFKQNWKKMIKADIYEFKFNSSLQKKPQQLVYTQFKNDNAMNTYIKTLNTWKNKVTYRSDPSLFLSSHIVWNMNNKKMQQIQLSYLQNKYHISKYTDQLPICVFTTGYKIFSRDRHIYFFNSIEQQNYSNYHIVAVDDASPNNQGYSIYQYLNNSNFSLKNKIKLVVTLQKMGATALTYHWTVELCRKGDIVVHVDMDDMLIGRQVFKTLNALYHNPNLWYLYTRYLGQNGPLQLPVAKISKRLRTDVKNYRQTVDWRTSAMRTLRYEVFASVPVEYLIEYHFNESSQEFFPKFYDTDADRFLIYCHLELSGNKHIQFIDDVFYYYNTTHSISSKCIHQHEHFDEYKSRVKIPLQEMKNLEDKNITTISKNIIPNKILVNFRDRYVKYQKCLQLNNLTRNG